MVISRRGFLGSLALTAAGLYVPKRSYCFLFGSDKVTTIIVNHVMLSRLFLEFRMYPPDAKDLLDMQLRAACAKYEAEPIPGSQVYAVSKPSRVYSTVTAHMFQEVRMSRWNLDRFHADLRTA